MVGDIGAALTSLKAIKDLAEAMIGLRDAAAFQEKRFELQDKLLAAQSAVFAANGERTMLIERVGKLEQEVARLRAWDAEKKRYELKRWGEGAFARVLKESEANGEPVHALCAACYDRGVKSIIHSNRQPRWPDHAWDCPTCKFPLKASARALDEKPTS